MAIQNNTIDVESTRSVQICMNIRDGYLESKSASIYYSTGSGGIISESNDA